MAGSILETFYILFEAKAEKVKEGAKEGERAAEDLEKQVKKTDDAADKLGAGFLGMTRSAVGALAAIASVGALTAGVLNAQQQAADLHDFSQAINANIEDVDAWGAAVKQAGGSAEGFRDSLSTLAASMAQVDTTGKSRVLPFFKELGIDMLDAEGKARPVMDLLPELASAFERVGKQQALGIGRKLGLDQGTIMLLQQGRMRVDDLVRAQRELGVVTARDGEIADAYGDQMDDLARASRGAFLELATVGLPVLTSLASGLTSLVGLVRENSTFIGSLAAVVAAAYVPAMLSAAAATLAATWPMLVAIATVAAVGAALALLVDDIYNFVTGGESLIGQFLDWLAPMEKVKTTIDNLRRSFGALFGKREVRVYGKGVDESLANGKDFLGTAGSTPIAAQTSNSISNSSRTRSTAIMTGPITVQTAATSPEGVAQGLGGALLDQLRQTSSNFDDGVAY